MSRPLRRPRFRPPTIRPPRFNLRRALAALTPEERAELAASAEGLRALAEACRTSALEMTDVLLERDDLPGGMREELLRRRAMLETMAPTNETEADR